MAPGDGGSLAPPRKRRSKRSKQSAPRSRCFCALVVIVPICALSTIVTLFVLLDVEGGGSASVQGEYVATPASKTPAGFAAVCRGQGWDTADTWARLNAGKTWFEAPNGAYIYHNQLDGMWWIDAPSGAGIFKATGPVHAPPAAGYEIIGEHAAPVPSIRIFRG